MKHVILGLVAHVDAGKTTLSERMLYVSGKLRNMGRVDHKDAFLDYDTQERNRGITIFSKQASFQWNNNEYTFLDTPGHVDFSSEMERTLQVLDYAVLIINASDGVQAHTETIWKLLKHYHVPVFIFVNKMDITHTSKDDILDNIHQMLDDRCVDFTCSEEEIYENAALCSDTLLQEYASTNTISITTIQNAILKREVFPCCFGSALKGESITAFMDMIDTYTTHKTYPEAFGAIAYKVSYDNGTRLVHMKITGGTLHAKDKISEEEKVDQIRIYEGSKYTQVDSVSAGSICAVKGLENVYSTDVLGAQKEVCKPVLESYMNYKLRYPTTIDAITMMKYLRILKEEDAQVTFVYDENSQSINVRLMGEIQTEILKYMLEERFNVEVSFTEGEVVYKETIQNEVEGVGHYEPLRHYAEVHLLLSPLPKGSGIQIESILSEEELPLAWQKQVLSTLENTELYGVLTNSLLTDIKITLVKGKGHVKHTEGGDFREATLRALRQGLLQADSVLYEPYYEFELRVSSDVLSRAIYDLDNMYATYEIDSDNDTSIIKGSAPIAYMQNYTSVLASYTKGRGSLSCQIKGYDTCVESDKVIEKINYKHDLDIQNPSGSIFCKQGAGYFVKWDEVKNHMHLSAYLKEKESVSYQTYASEEVDEKELERIFERTYGPIKRRLPALEKAKIKEQDSYNLQENKPLCMLVDAYNVMFAWDSLKIIASENLDAARNKLIDILSSYKGYKKCEMIVVFDAYKVKESMGSKTNNGSIHIVYTKHAQTADTYIEKTTHELSSKYRVIVVTSDHMEQIIVSGQGAHIMSSRELEKEVSYMFKKGYEEFEEKQSKVGNRMLEELREMFKE